MKNEVKSPEDCSQEEMMGREAAQKLAQENMQELLREGPPH